MVETKDIQVLKALGGVDRIARRLGVDPKRGLDHDQEGKNRDLYGSNDYPEQPLIKELFEDSLEYLCRPLPSNPDSICFNVFFGIASDGLEEGWYDGAGLLIAVTALVSAFTRVEATLAVQGSEQTEQHGGRRSGPSKSREIMGPGRGFRSTTSMWATSCTCHLPIKSQASCAPAR